MKSHVLVAAVSMLAPGAQLDAQHGPNQGVPMNSEALQRGIIHLDE